MNDSDYFAMTMGVTLLWDTETSSTYEDVRSAWDGLRRATSLAHATVYGGGTMTGRIISRVHDSAIVELPVREDVFEDDLLEDVL